MVALSTATHQLSFKGRHTQLRGIGHEILSNIKSPF